MQTNNKRHFAVLSRGFVLEKHPAILTSPRQMQGGSSNQPSLGCRHQPQLPSSFAFGFQRNVSRGGLELSSSSSLPGWHHKSAVPGPLR